MPRDVGFAVRTTRYRLLLDPVEPRLIACGELDLAAVADLAETLARVDPLAARLRVDLSGVTFCDTSALEPLVDATRWRAVLGQSPIAIESTSPAVDRLLDILQLDGHPLLDVDAWDRIRSPAPPRLTDRRSELPA
jgi:anti-anti-sigma regulatory factor